MTKHTHRYTATPARHVPLANQLLSAGAWREHPARAPGIATLYYRRLTIAVLIVAYRAI
jgi:hypothetical protein